MKIATFTEGDGADIVLMHGWTHDHRSMQPIIDLLKSHYRITAVDLPGAGQSDWDDSFDSVNQVADAMLDALPERAIYLGWSWGGAVCQSIAGRYPERVKQLILLGSVPKFIEAPDWPGVPAPGFIAGFSPKDDEAYKQMILDYYDVEFADAKAPDAHKHITELLNKTGLTIPRDIEIQGIKIIDKEDLRQEFAAIQCPIDMIIGTKDESVPVDWEKIKALNPRVKIHFIENAQHMPFWTYPEEFNAVLQEVLSLR